MSIMRVQVRTTPSGLLGQLAVMTLIGAGAVIAVGDHQGWLHIPTAGSVTAPTADTVTPAPMPTVAGVVVPARKARPLTHRHPTRTRTTPPPGSIDLLGIIIPPPGWNDGP